MRKGTSGFTIVELLIVIIVIAILAAISFVAYNGVQNRAKKAVVESDLSQAGKQLAMHKATNGTFPSGAGAPPASLTPSSGTAYEYTSDGSSFCLSAVNGTIGYYVTNTGTPQEGVCVGHTAPIAGGGSSLTCDPGYIPVPGNNTYGTSDFCVAKYEAKNVGSVATSQAAGTPWVSITQDNAISTANAACGSCHLITEAEWMTITANVLGVSSNWSGGSVGSGFIYSGHNDHSPNVLLAGSTDDNDGYFGTNSTTGSNQRRTLTLSNGEVIWDLAGNVWEWTSGTISGGQQPGFSGETAYAWKQWNDGSLLMNGLPFVSSVSSIGGASGWSSTQGIGMLVSNYGETGVRAFARGGYRAAVYQAGALA